MASSTPPRLPVPRGPVPRDAPVEDPDLRDLPRGPRTARLVTLAVLAVTALASATLAWSLLPDARYSLRAGEPENLGALAALSLDALGSEASDANRWVRGTGALSDRAVRYRRPLDGDSYRLAQIQGNEELWVQMRIPEGMREEHFIPPASFVGRLLPLESDRLRYGRLQDAVGAAGADPSRAFLLVDGEAPSTARWSLALVALFGGFTVFCLVGFVRLARPVRDFQS